MSSPSYQEARGDGSGCRAAPRPAVELRNVGKTFGAVQAAYVRNLRVLGGGLLAVLRHVYLPATWGWLLAGVRLSVGFALLATILSEIVASNSGIGYQLARAQAALAPANVIALIGIIGVIAALIDGALVLLGTRAGRWRVES